MKRSIILLLPFFLSGLFSFPADSFLQKVKTIGDDRDDYTFFMIYSAVMSDKKDIFICDHKGNFVAKYDWKGNFIKRIGQAGQGNGDLLNPTYLCIYNQKLYIMDPKNYRIAWTDLDLTKLYYKRYGDLNKNPLNRFFKITFLKNGTLLGNSFTPWDRNGRMVLFDFNAAKVIKCFFNRYPIEVSQKESDIATGFNKENSKIDKDRLNKFLSLAFYALPMYGIDTQMERLLISFQYPGNPVKFYLYSKDGRELKTIEYPLEKKYSFPRHLLENKPIKPSESHYSGIDSILFYKGYFLVFLVELDFKKDQCVDKRCKFLVFDREGQLRDTIPTEKGLKPMFISNDGYLLARDYDSEEEQLLIYKVNINY